MDSKLPQSTGFKRTNLFSNEILPIDRTLVRPIGFVHSSSLANKTVAGVGDAGLNNYNSTSYSYQPFSGDITILDNGTVLPEPFLGSSTGRCLNAHSKLRRSRSACNIREMKTPSTIPAKISRFVSSGGGGGGGGGGSGGIEWANSSTAFPTTTTLQYRTNNATASRPITSRTAAPTTTSRNIPLYDLKSRFQDLLEKHKNLKTKNEKQSEDMVEMESPLSLQLEKITTRRFAELERNHKIVVKERDELNIKLVALQDYCESLQKQNQVQSNELVQCKNQFNMERKLLHNTILDLRGNIRVFCRVRPPLACEDYRLLCGWKYKDEATVEIQNLDVNKHKQGALTFSFDHVFHPYSDQSDIFEMVSPLIQSALDGYNICIFAYGQTGSGKSYTMDGESDNIGVIPRTVDLLFDSFKGYKNLGWEYEIKATFLEIYNEVLYDLLSNEQKEMEIRMSKNNKNDIYVSNITEESVTSVAHLHHLMNVAKGKRATAVTVGNERSSRSHAVTKLELIGRHAEKQEISIGTINLVDLAGSESPKTSVRMLETKSINRSLSELTNVILALLQKQDHIPYRNSKLTHLLMPSLSGNSKTIMFINVAPFQDCFQESVNSLRFATSVKSCKMSKAKRNRCVNVSSFEK